MDRFLNKIVCGDCVELLKEIPDNSVDCIITDPPYDISVEGAKIHRTYEHYNWKRRSDIGLDFGKWDREFDNNEDYFNWCEQWFKELVRILKEKSWMYIFFDKQKTGIFDLYLAPKYNIKSRTIYIWQKSNPCPSFRKCNYVSGTEHIWVGSKGDSKLKNYLAQKYMNNYFVSPNASAYKVTEHSTEKPEKLIKHLIRINTNENDVVLDCFMGSGTTASCSLQLRRNFIGIEKSEEYCKMAEKRLESIKVITETDALF